MVPYSVLTAITWALGLNLATYLAISPFNVNTIMTGIFYLNDKLTAAIAMLVVKSASEIKATLALNYFSLSLHNSASLQI
jgi:hypothetical protein